jgi:hypothetical protein
LPALAGFCALGFAVTTQARDASVCAGNVTVIDARIERTISCAVADVSRYFLISSDLKALSDKQRVDVLQRPTYYTLAYMAAALTNDIQTDFAQADVQSATYAGVIAVRGTGGRDVDHPAVTISLDRKAEQGIDWKTFAPMNLFSLPGAQQTPWLRQTLSLESAAK